MERFSERELAGKLRGFEQVWRRVYAARAPRETAAGSGVELMPRRNRCRSRRGCGRG